MESRRVGHDCVTKQQQQMSNRTLKCESRSFQKFSWTDLNSLTFRVNTGKSMYRSSRRLSRSGFWEDGRVVEASLCICVVISSIAVRHALAMDHLSSTNIHFTLDLYQKFTEIKPNGNIIFSPMSITSALAMVCLGAKGNTAAQIAKALSLSTTSNIHSELQKFISDIKKPDAPYLLKLANRLYGEKTYSFLQEFLDSTRKFYEADLMPMNFVGASEESRGQINQWVEAQTNGKIKELLKTGSVNSMTRMALVNAIYFKGDWMEKFDANNTKEMPFKINQNKSKPVQMMYQKSKFPFNYISEYDLQVLELPYKGEELSMFVLLPKESNSGSSQLQKLEKELTLEKINEWTDRRNMDNDTDISVHLPKFKLEEDYEMKAPLALLGMTDVFDDTQADLSGMNGSRGLFLSTVVHNSFVEVNEEGTEAAAATAGIVACAMFREEYFVADHPFLFFIRHKKSKTILFFGRFSSP